MLNISNVSVSKYVDKSKFSAFKTLEGRSVSSYLIKVLILLSVLSIAALFLPWTQNIRSNGFVTTLNPDDKPQYIQSILDGKIEDWYVMEGDTVNIGDTILRISEIKEAYLDPNLLQQTKGQIDANDQSLQAYDEKANNLYAQYEALVKNKAAKASQNLLKIEQTKIKLQTLELEVQAAEIKVQNSTKQLERIQSLFDQGIKSLTDLEVKRFANGEAIAKLNALNNKMISTRQELEILELTNETILNEFDDKIAKSKSDRTTAISAKYNTKAKVDKLQSQFNQYQTRTDNYYIKSPINGVITKTFYNGIGQTIKAGDKLASIVPLSYQLAVETFVKPRDMPLIQKGQKVMIQFDGWPAIVFSGWPGNSYGTFDGKIYAIDNDISDNGLYRVLVSQKPGKVQWPDALRVGGGSNSLILLNEVPLYYEIWRVLNGFPADFYNNKTIKENKTKAPIKKIK
jgi:multidrug resistance efflux pump